jgi:hypothetical protein
MKVPSKLHERAHAVIGHEIFLCLITDMAVDHREVVPVQSSKYHGNRRSSKESDSAYKNQNVRPQDPSWRNPTVHSQTRSHNMYY